MTMHRAVRIALRRRGQRDGGTWAQVTALVGQLRDRGVVPLEVVGGLVYKYVFEHEDDPGLTELLAALERARELWGVAWDEYRVITMDPSDYRTADLIVVAGVGLEGFVLNEAEAIGPPMPCPECGTATASDRPLLSTIRVDESRLRDPAYTSDPAALHSGTSTPPESWDVVTTPNLGIIVSRRLVQFLEHVDATGWATDPVQTADGRDADDLVLLQASSVDARPCVEHSHLGAEGVCATCGLVRGERLRAVPLHVRRSDLRGLDIVSSGRSRHGPLILARELVEAMIAAGFAGIQMIEPRRICPH
jgi:hypothetical protein